MDLSLRQITNTLANQQNSLKKSNLTKDKKQTKKDLSIRFPWKELVAISGSQFDFGLCIPNTVYERVITLTLKEDLSEPVSFAMEIVCSDQKLNSLPEFVFAIKKDKEFEFNDCYRFRLNRRGKYDFVIGVKTPNITGYHVKSELKIYSQFSDMTNHNEYYSVNLQQRVCLPVIECSRELLSHQSYESGKLVAPLRVLKFSQIKTKLKKEVKIPFKLETDTKLTLFNQMIGAIEQRADLQKNLIQISPKQMVLMGKGVFVMTFKFGFTEHLSQYLQGLHKRTKNEEQVISYTLRRILVMKVHMTNIYFHFPIEVNFFLGNKKGDNLIGE